MNANQIMDTLQNFQLRPSKTRIEVNDKTSKVVFSRSEFIAQRTNNNLPCAIIEKKKHKKHGTVMTPITLCSNCTSPLTEFDRAVLNICVAEWKAGNKYTTVNIIFRALVGKVGEIGAVPTSAMKQKIVASILKLMGSILTLDISESYQVLKYANGDELKYIKSAILPCCFVQAKINGQIVDAVFFDREPPLFTVSNLKDQIVRYDASLIDIPNMKSTVTNISLINYVMRRIVEIKTHRQLAPTITFNDIYKKCGIDNANKKVKFYARDTVIRLFQNLVDKQFIDSFEIVKSKSGNKIHAISFKFTPPAESNITNPATDDDSSNEKFEEKTSYRDSGTSYRDSGTSYRDSGTSYRDSGTLPHKKSRRKARHNQQSSNTAKIA